MRNSLAILAARLFKWRPGGYLRSGGALFGWLLVRALSQALMVLLLARLLGSEGYGEFVAVLAVVGFVTPLAGLGLGGVLLRDGARDPANLPKQLGAALGFWWPSTLVFTLVAVLAVRWALPSGIPLTALTAFVYAEILSSTCVELAGRAEQSQHQMRAFGAITTGLALSRLGGLLGYAILFHPNSVGWMWTYVASSLLYTAAVVWRLAAKHHPIQPLQRDWAMVREGFPFTVGALSVRIQAEFNKPLLAHLGYGQVGNFSVAQRVIDLAGLPLQALLEAFWPRLYADENPNRKLWLTGCAVILLALLGGATLVLVAPWVPHLLGPDFERTVEVLIWLAWLPAMQVMRNLLSAAVIARRAQSYLYWVYLFGGIASILLNSALVPHLGLLGAVWALYSSELVALLMLLSHLAYHRSVSRRLE